MTNRDYLRSLSNEKLAELLDEDIICDRMIETCPDGNCKKCITNWLETGRKPNVEKGQIRETDLIKWLIVAVNESRDNCLMLSETGTIRDIPTDAVETRKIVTDETAEMFYDRVFNELKNNNTNNVPHVLPCRLV